MLIFCIAISFLFFPVAAQAGIIGEDTIFNVLVLSVMAPNPDNPGASEAFNFFFSVEIFFGLVALFVRLVLRSMRM